MISKKGFTLIELLVVIAIIGILASIVLVTFPSAQGKAKDSRIISALSQSRTLLTIIEDSENSYNKLACTDDGSPTTDCTCTADYVDLQVLCSEIAHNGGALVIAKGVVSGDNRACLSSDLNTDGGGTFYCVDDSGVTKRTDGLGTPLAACSPTTFRCQ